MKIRQNHPFELLFPDIHLVFALLILPASKNLESTFFTFMNYGITIDPGNHNGSDRTDNGNPHFFVFHMFPFVYKLLYLKLITVARFRTSGGSPDVNLRRFQTESVNAFPS